MAPSTPRKRQIIATAQSSKITNFFKPSNNPLPEEVQSGLLSVGMRVRKSVQEGYKSGSYAYNKHFPSVGLPAPNYDTDSSSSLPSSQESNFSASSSPTKKRTYDIHQAEQQLQQKAVPASISAWARSVKVPTGAAAGKKNSAFYQAVGRKNVTMVGSEDFGEAEFLKPVDEMEE